MRASWNHVAGDLHDRDDLLHPRRRALERHKYLVTTAAPHHAARRREGFAKPRSRLLELDQRSFLSVVIGPLLSFA
jgi:hypothetical protein